ncbi:MAG: alpha-L-fucosidase [Puniceicoccales bacterium]|jgi:alpha-L-fucosidase|nr:alpha-L-fucosidase [Puniceicoccales bacterium]
MKKLLLSLSLLAAATGIFAGTAAAGNTAAAGTVAAVAAPAYGSADYPAYIARRAEELKSLRWGMFICWSFSTFSGHEWTYHVKDVSFFRATGVDTDQWARTAKEAGMGYILFLTKHHDGFCLWDTATTDRKVTRAPLGRDVLRELRASCDKYGIKLALYFSEGEFVRDGWPAAKGGHRVHSGTNPEVKKAQLRELLTQYGPIEYIWFDHAVGTGGLDHAATAAFCKSLQPGCFIGYNHGDQSGADIRLGEMGRPGPLNDITAAGPYATHGAGKTPPRHLLAEFTYPILPGHEGGAMWFYSLPRHDHLVRPVVALYKDYLGAVKYGNIFSLDVGPDYAGKLRAVDVATLRAVGDLIRHHAILPAPASQGKPTTASSIWGKDNAAGAATDGIFDTRWGAARTATSGWLEVNLGTPKTIRRVVVDESTYPRTQKFRVEYLADNAAAGAGQNAAGAGNENWKPVVTGGRIRAGYFDYELPAPVTATRWRLVIESAAGTPSINEFALYE